VNTGAGGLARAMGAVAVTAWLAVLCVLPVRWAVPAPSPVPERT